MNRLFVVGFAILAVLGIVLVCGNSQTAVSENVAPAVKDAPDADAASFKRSVEASMRTVGDRLRDSVSILDFIPPEEHEAIANRTSTYDCAADFQDADIDQERTG